MARIWKRIDDTATIVVMVFIGVIFVMAGVSLF